MKTLNTLILILIMTTTSVVWAGGDNCDSLTTGNWSASSTWTNCNGGIPQDDDYVTIKSGHVVTLDVNTNEINSLTVDVGGDFDVAFNAAGLTLLGSGFDGVNFDLSNASIDLLGDLTIDAQTKDIMLGSVDGAFGLTLNSTAETLLTGIIGGTTELTSLITDAGGTTVFADTNGGVNDPNVIVNGPRIFNDSIFLNGIVNIKGTGGAITFNSTINSNSNHALIISSVGNSTITFNDDVGLSNPLGSFRIFNSVNSTVELNLDQFNTIGLQSWDTNLLLNSSTDVVSLTSTGDGVIVIGSGSYTIRSQTDGEDAFFINTDGAVTLNAVIGDNSQQLSHLTLNSSASATINSSTITVTGTQSYLGPVVLGNDSILSASIIDIQSTVDNGGFDLTTDVANMTGINGAISGSGDLIKQGVGDLALAVNNSYTGDTLIMAGTLFLLDTTNSNPIASSSTIEIASAAILDPINISSFIIPAGQTLSGAGSLNTNFAAASDSFVSPGSGSSRGILSTLNAEFNPGAQFNITLDGSTAGTEHDQLSVTGNVGLSQNRGAGDTYLNVTVSASLPAGGQYIILANDGIEAISGIFNVLSEGSSIAVGNRNFSISYVGGDGNDIELTEISCQSVQAGLWSDSNTWANCDGVIPQTTDDVNILHAVSFDADATVQSLDFGPAGDFDVAASGGGLSLNITATDVDFRDIDIELFGDFTINNTNNKINFGAISGNFNLTINSNQRVSFFDTHTSNLNSIITDAGGSTRIANNRTFQLSGDIDSVFNDALTIGASARIVINQTGTGSVILNENLTDKVRLCEERTTI